MAKALALAGIKPDGTLGILSLDKDGNVNFTPTITIDPGVISIASQQMHGSNDAGTTWIPLSLNADGKIQELLDLINATVPRKSIIILQDCTAANTEYAIDVNTALSKNSKGGFLKSKSSNTGEVSVAFSDDGVAYSTYIPDIQPGESISLDGINIDSIKVKSTVAGDDVIVEVH